MANFKRTQILPSLRSKDVQSADTVYWKRLDFPVTIKEYGAVSSIDFCSTTPNYYAVTCGSKVQIYDPDSNQVWRSIGRFKNTAYGASFRKDGKLIAAGGEEMLAKLFTVETGGQLRIFKGHKGAVNSCKFLGDGYRLATFSDDRKIRCWDISTEKTLTRLKGHTDIIRCGCVGNTNVDMVVSGSYDKTVRVWDARDGKETMQLDHGWPVESVMVFPNDALLVSAGGTVIKVWDLVAGGRQLVQLSQHHRNVTSMCFCSNYQRLLSGSMDRHVKIYDVATYEVVHTLDYPAPVLTVGVSPDDKIIAVGMTDGLLSTQRRKPETESTPKPAKKRRMSFRYMIGKGAEHVPSDLIQKETKEDELPRYDHFLRTFQHSRALDTVLVGNWFTEKRPDVVIALLQELIHRGALKTALAGRQYDSLAKLMKFIAKNLGRQRFARTLIDVTSALFDVYQDQISDMDEKLIQLFRRLQATIILQAEQLKEMSRTLGCLEMVASLAASSSSPPAASDDEEFKTASADPSNEDNEEIVLHEVLTVNQMA